MTVHLREVSEEELLERIIRLRQSIQELDDWRGYELLGELENCYFLLGYDLPMG